MRGTCRVCGRKITVRTNGTLRAHGPGMSDYTRSWCLGSSRTPVEDTTTIITGDTGRARADWFEDITGEPRL